MAELTPIDWALRPLKQYAQFSGRSPRAEYWWYILATTVSAIALGFVDEALGGPVIGSRGLLSLIFTLGLIVPGLSVLVRRLHDIGRSGWWALLSAGSYVFVVVGFLAADPSQIFSPDQGASLGLLLMLMLAIVIGGIVLLVFTVTQGDEGPNRYGADPYRPDERLEEIFA